jgi:hypothetical protein
MAVSSNSRRRLPSATPFTSPDVKHTNRRPQVTIRFSRFTSGRSLARRRVRGGSNRDGLRFGLKTRAPDPSRLHNRATALRLSVVDPSEPHSVLPIHCRTSTRNRHRRSTWAGVSWPNDDGIDASGGDNIDRTPARTRTARSTRNVTSLCALSSARLPVRLLASYSRHNGRATPQRFIEARQHESRHLRAVLLGQPARRVHSRSDARLSDLCRAARLDDRAGVLRPRGVWRHAASFRFPGVDARRSCLHRHCAPSGASSRHCGGPSHVGEWPAKPSRS